MTVTLLLLATLCRPEGLDIGYLRDIAARPFGTATHDDSVDRIAGHICSAILMEIGALDHFRS